MKEIGGYFEFEELISKEYHKGLIALNTARNALQYVLKGRQIRKIYIPYYLCDVVSIMLKKSGNGFEYYNIDSEFLPVFNENLLNDEYVYIVNYYGQITNEKVDALKRKFGKIILDNTHAFFQNPIEGIDTIYSCRKFFGVPDGAYLSTDCKSNMKIKVDNSRDRMTHLMGRYEGLASDYYADFQEIDESFKNESLKYMSKLTHNILGAIDYEKVFEIRNENYTFLRDHLFRMNKLNLSTPNGAFAYPFYFEKGIEVRKKLAEKKIYIPTLWPNVLRDCPKDSIEYQYAANMLPLPCDQRYNIADMETLVREVIKCIS